MPTTDPRIDDYIARSQPFAQPILTHLRKLIHEACPGVEETIKWSFPHFSYRNGVLCSFASFKQHCAFTFWFGSIMKDPHKILAADGERTSMGHLGPIKSLADLPADNILVTYLQEAKQLIESGAKLQRRQKTEAAPALEVPDYFLSTISQHPQAHAHFKRFSPSQQREYVSWITEAKTPATRDKRMATAIEWLAEGKRRNWKYEKC